MKFKNCFFFLKKSRTKSYSKSKSTSRSRSRSHSADSRRRSRSYSRDRDRRSRSRSSDRHRDSDRAPNTKPSNVLSVFGLGAYTSERDLKDAFGKYGRVTDVKIIYDGKTGRSRGFGFIYFNKTEEASVAKEELHGHDLDGHKIRVEFSITRKPHNPTPGIYMGYTNK